VSFNVQTPTTDGSPPLFRWMYARNNPLLKDTHFLLTLLVTWKEPKCGSRSSKYVSANSKKGHRSHLLMLGDRRVQ
jgi:hypothetical protein